MIQELIQDIKEVQPGRNIEKEIRGMSDFEATEFLIEERQSAWEGQRDNGNPNFK